MMCGQWLVDVQGNAGIILVQTQTFVIVAFYNQYMHASVAVEAVECLGENRRAS